jgi:hypothetical protein
MTMLQMNPDTIREDWLAAVDSLVKQVSEWAQEKNWTVEPHPQIIKEAGLDSYTTPVMG